MPTYHPSYLIRNDTKRSTPSSEEKQGIAAWYRARLERLLRYCARPAFALERLARLDEHRVVYRLPKPPR